MSSDEILSRVEGAVLIVTFNRPNKYNALNVDMLDGLQDAFDRFQVDDALHVLLIQANGKYFSSGLDVTTIGDTPVGSPSRFRTAYAAKARHRLWDDFESVEKPVVVAHDGPCLGAALEMSLSCDFRLASERAAYGLPEFAMGMIPGSGGTSRLARLVGPHWARWLIMAGKRVEAQQALTIGLIHQISPAESFEADIYAFCDALAAQPPEAMAAAKLAIELTHDLDRSQARHVERLINSSLSGGDEQHRLFEAFQTRFDRKRETPAPISTSAPRGTTDQTPCNRKSSDPAVEHVNGEGNLGSISTIEGKLRDAFTTLTERERQVTARILQGKSALQIAHDLKLTEETIATYRKRAYQRLAIGGRYELIQLFLGLGFRSSASSQL
jgi:enoyl-CoA hydratase